MEIRSSTTGDAWVAACPREDCTFRFRSGSFTEAENAADRHEYLHERKDANERVRKEWEAKATDILTPHLGHTALLQGYHEREITARSLEPDDVTWAYGGYVVECKTCDISLSEQWNG